MTGAAVPQDGRLVVQKFGGSSLATPERVRQRRRGASRQPPATERPVASSSRRWATRPTSCIGLAAQVSGAAHLREVDMLLAAGEQISIAMLTMALLDLGVPPSR